MNDAGPATTPAMTQEAAPIVKVRTVPLPPERAFHLFTRRMGEWWPLVTHSIAAENAVGVRFEERLGGRVIELTADGTGYAWADVEQWDPPRSFVLAWHPSPQPTTSSRVEVRFDPSDNGTTVTLQHSGWDELGPDGAALRERYDSGWDTVLAQFTALAADE